MTPPKCPFGLARPLRLRKDSGFRGRKMSDREPLIGPEDDPLIGLQGRIVALELMIVLRAARALAAEAGVTAGARLVLDKHLPVASGIGGGSADAAAALRLLCRAVAAGPRTARRSARLAAALGADVPVCLRNRPMRMGGVGEILRPRHRAAGMWDWCWSIPACRWRRSRCFARGPRAPYPTGGVA